MTDSSHYILQDETYPGRGTIQEPDSIPLNDGCWSYFQPIRYNEIQEGPSNWAAYATGRLRIAQTGSGGDVYEKGKDYPGSWGWASWTNLGKGDESLTGPPAFAHHGTQYDLFAVGTSGRIWHRVYKGGSWNDWTALTTAAGSPVVAKEGAGVAAVYGRDHLRLFYISPGHHVYQTYYDDGWTSQNLDGDYRGTPAVVVSGNQVDLFVTGAAGNVFHKSRKIGGSWSDWTEIAANP